MKKSLIAVATTLALLLAVNVADMRSSASTQATVTEVAVTKTAPTADKKPANESQYIVTAMYNGELVALDCWDTNNRNRALTSPTILNWPGEICLDLTLHVVGTKIKQVNLVDRDFCFIAKIGVTTLKNGAQIVKFEMDPDMAGTLHTRTDDPTYVENADFYFEIIPTTGKVEYTSVRY